MKKIFVFILAWVFIFSFMTQGFALTAEEEIQVLKQQVQELMKRIEQIEQQQVKQKEDFSKQKEELVKKFALEAGVEIHPETILGKGK